MKSHQEVRKSESHGRETAWPLLLAVAVSLTAMPRMKAATHVVVWDTGSRLADATGAGDRTGWKSVPSELFVFEADPPKAASDPGYYGREYSFQGDAVVENRSLTAVFVSAKGHPPQGKALGYIVANEIDDDGARHQCKHAGSGKKAQFIA